MSSYIVDAQLPPALASMLRKEGFQAIHVTDIMLQDTDDSEIWEHAIKHDLIVVTKDEDFPRSKLQSKVSPRIVWVRIGNTSRKALLEWFKPLIPTIEARLAEGNTLIEIR